MNENEIESKMKDLAKIIEYDFNDIGWLKKAMYCQTTGKKKYQNQPLSTLGDTILKFTLAEYLYDQGKIKRRLRKKELKVRKIKV